MHRRECPHSTLHDTTRGYDEVTRKQNARDAARAARREAELEARRQRNARPITRTIL